MCLFPGVTERRLPRAVVVIASFLKHHLRFGGGIVVFHDGLPEERRAVLETAFALLRCEPVRPAPRERRARLGAVLTVDGEDFHLESGHARQANDLVPHGAFNGGEADRIHLISEVFGYAGAR